MFEFYEIGIWHHKFQHITSVGFNKQNKQRETLGKKTNGTEKMLK